MYNISRCIQVYKYGVYYYIYYIYISIYIYIIKCADISDIFEDKSVEFTNILSDLGNYNIS